jgi:hypothetical protein
MSPSASLKLTVSMQLALMRKGPRERTQLTPIQGVAIRYQDLHAAMTAADRTRCPSAFKSTHSVLRLRTADASSGEIS